MSDTAADMDEDTAVLIFSLLQQDAQDTIDHYGDQDAAYQATTDQELSLNEWNSQLQQQIGILNDAKLAKSIGQDDLDNDAAHNTNNNDNDNDDNNNDNNMPQEQGQSLINQILGLRFGGVADGLECVACTEVENSPYTVRAPCSHVYCQSCTVRLFADSVVDESLFPPQCCRQAIPLSTAQALLDPTLTRKFQEKSIERNDPDRTYCANPVCSQYILPHHVENHIATCLACNRWTCSRCKRRWHAGDCVDDDDNGLLEMAGREGWQRCSGCRNLVELRIGCNHITCRCGFEFCYVCGDQWKTCDCVLWDEDRLLDRAQQVVARDQQAPPAQVQVQQMAQNLRDRNECGHQGRWRRIEGRNLCEECRFHLPDFILECRQCRLRACLRCRLNRL